MPYDHGSYPLHSDAPQGSIKYAGLTGAGASAPTVTVTTVLAASLNKGTGATIVRNGAGDYTFTLLAKRSPSLLVDEIPNVRGPTKLVANVVSASLDSQGRLVVQVKTWDADTANAADLTTSDYLTLHIHGGANKAV